MVDNQNNFPNCSSCQQAYELLKLSDLGKVIPNNKFYVYAIIENGNVCYIGKGKKNRVLSHFNDSTNQLLSSKIKENINIYDWIIIEVFEEEIDSLMYEKELITDCKKVKHNLYNNIYYVSGSSNNQIFRGIFGLFRQYEKMIFPYDLSPIMGLNGIIDNVFEIIKGVCDKTPKNKIPVYKSKPLNELSYHLTLERGKYRVNIY